MDVEEYPTLEEPEDDGTEREVQFLMNACDYTEEEAEDALNYLGGSL